MLRDYIEETGLTDTVISLGHIDVHTGLGPEGRDSLMSDAFGAINRKIYAGHEEEIENPFAVLKKNLANKIFGYLARCKFWLKLGWWFWIW